MSNSRSFDIPYLVRMITSISLHEIDERAIGIYMKLIRELLDFENMYVRELLHVWKPSQKQLQDSRILPSMPELLC